MSHLQEDTDNLKRPAAPGHTQTPKRAKTTAGDDDDEYPLPPEPDYVLDEDMMPTSVASNADMMYRLVARDGLWYEAREDHEVQIPDLAHQQIFETVVIGGSVRVAPRETITDLVKSTRAHRLQVNCRGRARIESIDDAVFNAGITELCLVRPVDCSWKGTKHQLDALDAVDHKNAGSLLAHQTNLKSLRIGPTWLSANACNGIGLKVSDARRILDNTKLQHIWVPVGDTTASILEQFTRQFGHNVRSLGLYPTGPVPTKTLRSIVIKCPRLHTLQLVGPIDLAAIESDLHALVHLRDLRVDIHARTPDAVKTKRPLGSVPSHVRRLAFSSRSVKEEGIRRAVHHLEFIHVLECKQDLGLVVDALAQHKGRPPAVRLGDHTRFSSEIGRDLWRMFAAVPGVRLVRPQSWALRPRAAALKRVRAISDAVAEQTEFPHTVADLVAEFAFE